MKNALVLLAFLGVIVGCSNSSNKKQGLPTGQTGKTVTKDSIPVCVRQEIEAIEKKTTPNPPVQIDEYQYNGKRVFLYTADCCDQFNTLYDENCKSICAPSGGFEGGGDHKCGDFSSTAKHIKVVWIKADK